MSLAPDGHFAPAGATSASLFRRPEVDRQLTAISAVQATGGYVRFPRANQARGMTKMGIAAPDVSPQPRLLPLRTRHNPAPSSTRAPPTAGPRERPAGTSTAPTNATNSTPPNRLPATAGPPPHTTSRIRRAAAGSRGSPSVSWNEPHMSAL